MKRILLAALALQVLVACGGTSPPSPSASRATTTSTAAITVTTTTTAATTSPNTATTLATTTPPATMPSGDPTFPGYPKLVAIGSVDYRVANWYKAAATTFQLVALAPGVYTPYNPNVSDLNSYLAGPNSGDCAARRRYFPHAGGACWEGVR